MMTGVGGRNKKLLLLLVLFMIIGGGMLHCAHVGTLCAFSDHHDLKHHQITPLICCMIVISVLLLFPTFLFFYTYQWRLVMDNRRRGHTILPFRPPKLAFA